MVFRRYLAISVNSDVADSARKLRAFALTIVECIDIEEV